MLHPRRTLRRTAAVLALAFVAGALAACAQEYPQTTFRPVTEFGDLLNDLFENTFWWTIGIMVVVEIAILVAIFRFRERPGQAPPKQVHGNTKLEILWTIIPAIIVVFITVPTVQGIFAINRDPPEDALEIRVISHQWWWEFRYPEYGITTANQLHIPVGRPIHLVMNSADVVHSFWVPRIGGKRDTNPIPAGTENPVNPNVNELVFTVREAGRYPGVCAEYCGLSHAHMRFMTVAQDSAEFAGWVEDMRVGDVLAGAAGFGAPAPAQPQQPPVEPTSLSLAAAPSPAEFEDPLIAQGRELFVTRACVACHAVAGTRAQGVLGPNLTRMGARWSIGAGVLENTPRNLARWIVDPQEFKPGALMPGVFEGAAGVGPTRLTETEVRAIAAYLTSLQ